MAKKTYLEHIGFIDGIRGKVLDRIAITNENECRYISVEFQDKTEVTIYIDIRMRGRLTLSDWTTGNEEILETLGRIPDEREP